MLVVPVRGGWGRAVAWTVAAALVCVTVWLLVALGDLWTWFPLLGFLLAVVGLLVVVGAVLVALVALVRRRRRLVEPAAAAG